MIARGLFSFCPPRLHASSCFPSKSFVSPTYAKTAGGCTHRKMSARRHLLSLFSQSPLSALLLFNHLRTLSFSVSNLSAVLPISSALLRQKRGVHPLVLHLSQPFRRTPFSRTATLSACFPLTNRWPLSVTLFPASPSPRENLRRVANRHPLTPFAATLMKKQRGTGYWPALSAVEGSCQRSSLSAVDCRLLASHFFPPPCPSSPFPLQWGYPFPVITGENQ
jgi:hypothetical protein